MPRTTHPKLLLSLLSLLMLASNCALASLRDNYGQNSYPIWTPLSTFEESTVSSRFAAQGGDPDALLALYVMASGHYNSKDFNAIKRTVNTFIAKLTKQSIAKLNPKEQGRVANSAMHLGFFSEQLPSIDDDSQAAVTSPHQNALPSNHYKAEQSALAGIFINQDFNCISSSLLYAVIVRKLGLHGKGVLVPSHAFIELEIDIGETVDVETTSHAGFDQKHDADFYANDNQRWATSRGLTPVTYNDYLNRERVPFWKLGTRNMLHQHTHPNRMTDADRGRLAELSAFIDPYYEPAQLNRMAYYNQEIETMLAQSQWPNLARLIDTTYDTLERDVSYFSGNEPLQHSFWGLNLVAIKAFAELNEADRAIYFIRQSYALAANTEQISRVANNSIDALNSLLKATVNQQDFETGLYLLNAIEPYASENPHFATSTQWLYSQWAEYYWKQALWSQAVTTLEDYFQQPYIATNSADMYKNLAGAYSNWVNAELAINNTEVAKAIIQQCQSQYLEPLDFEISARDTSVCKEASEGLQNHLKKTKSPSKTKS